MFMNELNYIVIIVIPNMHKYTSGFGLHDTIISDDTNLGVILTQLGAFLFQYLIFLRVAPDIGNWLTVVNTVNTNLGVILTQLW